MGGRHHTTIPGKLCGFHNYIRETLLDFHTVWVNHTDTYMSTGKSVNNFMNVMNACIYVHVMHS